MNKKMLNKKEFPEGVVPFISSLALWAWDKIFAKKKNRTSFYTLTGLLVLGGGIVSYLIINRVLRGSAWK
ncbi:MAG: hypothetical protein WAO23_04715 [Dethiobacteria bacterium]